MANDTFVVERRTSIASPAAAVFAELVDFRRWEAWSPWEGIDPSLRRTYSGPDSGVGAAYAWEGNRKVGSGRMEITGVETDAAVDIRIDFLKPFKATNQVRITLTPAGDTTAVTWTMTGRKTLITKIMGVFMSMDKMIGKDFEKGLAQLKSLVEAGV